MLVEVVSAVLRRLSPGGPVEAGSGSGSSMSTSSVGVVVGIIVTSGVGMYGMMSAPIGGCDAGGEVLRRGCRWEKALLRAWETRVMAGGRLLESGWEGECSNVAVLAE